MTDHRHHQRTAVVVKATIQMEPHDREAMMATLRDLMAVQNENARAVQRKRSWRDSEKAMAVSKYTTRVVHLAALHRALELAK